MTNNKPHFAIRISKVLLDKLKYIAEYNGRSGNKEIEVIIRKHVTEFEKEHGTIQITPKKE